MVKAISEIVAKDNPEVAAVLALVDIGKLAYKANRYIAKPISNMINNLGSNAFQKLWNAMKKNVTILDMDLYTGGDQGLKVVGKTVETLWYDIFESFGNPTLFDEMGKFGKYFDFGGIRFTFYPMDTTGNPAISIVIGNVTFKFRT